LRHDRLQFVGGLGALFVGILSPAAIRPPSSPAVAALLPLLSPVVAVVIAPVSSCSTIRKSLGLQVAGFLFYLGSPYACGLAAAGFSSPLLLVCCMMCRLVKGELLKCVHPRSNS